MKNLLKTICSMFVIASMVTSCSLPFGDESTNNPDFLSGKNANTSSGAPIPGSYVNTFTPSPDGKTLTVTIDQSTAKNISHLNFTLTSCDGQALSLSNVTSFSANGVDVMAAGLLGTVEGKGNSCYNMLADPFVKLDMGFTTPLVTLVIGLDKPVMAGQFLIKSSTDCWGLNDPKFMFTRVCEALPACFEDESAWATGQRYVTRGNWATYTAYQVGTVNVYAGKNQFAGTATFSAATGGNITLTIVMNSGWSLQEVSNPVKIQNYSVAPTGNPSPGRFAFKGTSLTVTLPLANFYGIHLDVRQAVDCPL
jgi:hypothetical protein